MGDQTLGQHIPIHNWIFDLQRKLCLLLLIYGVEARIHIPPVCSYLLPSNKMWWNCLTTIQRGGDRLVEESLDSVWVPRRFVVSELYPRVSITPPCAMQMEAADRPCQARVPPVALWHGLGNSIHALRVCEGLVVDNLTGFCDAEDSNLGTYMRQKHHKDEFRNDLQAIWTEHIEPKSRKQ